MTLSSLDVSNVIGVFIFLLSSIPCIVFWLKSFRVEKKRFIIARVALGLLVGFSICNSLVHLFSVLLDLNSSFGNGVGWFLSMLGYLIFYYSIFIYILFCWIKLVALHASVLTEGLSNYLKKIEKRKKLIFVSSILWILICFGGGCGYLQSKNEMQTFWLAVIESSVSILPIALTVGIICYSFKMKRIFRSLQKNQEKAKFFNNKITILSVVSVVALDLHIVEVLTLFQSNATILFQIARVWVFIWLPELTLIYTMLWFFNPFALQTKARSMSTSDTPHHNPPCSVEVTTPKHETQQQKEGENTNTLSLSTSYGRSLENSEIKTSDVDKDDIHIQIKT